MARWFLVMVFAIWFAAVDAAPKGEEGHHRERHNGHKEKDVVSTTTGKLRPVRKNTLGKEVLTFYGIPFAEPPVGDLRFKKPLSVKPWDGVLNADTPPNSCVQESYNWFPNFVGEEMWNPNTNLSEDCLYMNLWVPRKAVNQPAKHKLPILVWIYGGAYMGGTITLDIYNGDILAVENDAIVIAINYRVGAFGFLYLENDEAPGNQGMWDQVMALEWIKENARAFGGDPDSVTMFGESAGGGSVTFHLLSPKSRHLITRGIIQSGTINAPWSVMTAKEARGFSEELIDKMCNETKGVTEQLACLRDMPAANISVDQWGSYRSIMAFPSRPTIDGHFLPDHPMTMLAKGDFKGTELLIGSNKNEGTYFFLYDFLEDLSKDELMCMSRDRFLDIIGKMFPDHSKLERDAIIFQYTHWDDMGDECENTKKLAELVGDYMFICPSNAFAQAYSDHNLSVYYYYFTQRTSSNPWGDWMGVMHADEIEYVFGHPLNHTAGAKATHTRAEQELSRRIMAYFVRFARTGKPVEGNDWPLYTRKDPIYFTLHTQDNGKQGRGPRSHPCAFWNEFMPIIKPGTESLRGHCEKESFSSSPSSATNVQSCWTTSILAAVAAIWLTFQFHKIHLRPSLMVKSYC